MDHRYAVIVTLLCMAASLSAQDVTVLPYWANAVAPPVPFSDNFDTGTNLGARWTSGGTWSLSGGKATNAPTLGAEMWDAGADVFTSGTYGWVKYGTNTIANVSNELQIAFVDDAGGAYHFLRDTKDVSADLTVGEFYRFTFQSRCNTGKDYSFELNETASSIVYLGTLTNTTFATNTVTFKAQSTTGCYTKGSQFGAGDTVYVDNISLKPILASATYATIDAETNDVTVSGEITASSGVGAGIIVSYADTANLVLYRYAGGMVHGFKRVAGTWTLIVSATVTYVAGAVLLVEKSGTSYTVSYDGSALDVDTISDEALISNTKHGMAIFDSLGFVDDFSVTAP